MSAFTDKEIEYLNEQRLGRLATVNAEGNPHVVPVALRYNEELDAVDIGGHIFAGSKKFRTWARRGERRSWSMTCFRRGGRAGSRCVARPKFVPREERRS